LPGQAGRVGIQGGLEPDRLQPPRRVGLPVREGAGHGVTQQGDELGARHRRRRPGRGEGMEEVVRGGLEAQALAAGDREVRAVPALAARVIEREVLDLLAEGPGDGRVLGRVPVQRGGPAAVGAEDQEIGTRPGARKRPANTETATFCKTSPLTQPACPLPTETTCFGSAACSWPCDCCRACWAWFSWVTAASFCVTRAPYCCTCGAMAASSA